MSTHRMAKPASGIRSPRETIVNAPEAANDDDAGIPATVFLAVLWICILLTSERWLPYLMAFFREVL